jgi:hypothetical protein
MCGDERDLEAAQRALHRLDALIEMSEACVEDARRHMQEIRRNTMKLYALRPVALRVVDELLHAPK